MVDWSTGQIAKTVNGKRWTVNRTTCYPLSGELQSITCPNFELGTWNLELLPSDLRSPTSDLCRLSSVLLSHWPSGPRLNNSTVENEVQSPRSIRELLISSAFGTWRTGLMNWNVCALVTRMFHETWKVWEYVQTWTHFAISWAIVNNKFHIILTFYTLCVFLVENYLLF